MTLPMGRIAFGGDYNPEQWPREVWTEDMRLMRGASVSMVSVGIFSWAQVEPRDGEHTFDWFDEVMDNLSANGIAASLATMTASPPPWLARKHQEILPVLADGSRMWPGGRQAYCPSSPVYREYATRLVRVIARRYADHPALALWHIGNEYGCDTPVCYCDVSAEAFRTWLRARYGSVAELNEAWSTTFWSQRYDDFAEVLPPRQVPAFNNPTQQLDFARFSSDELLGCLLAEKAVIRELTPDVPVTTNFAGYSHALDLRRWAEELDVVSFDSYPEPFDSRAHVEAGLTYDIYRGARGGQPWLLMEQAPSAVNWRERNAAKEPGQMRLWSWQAVAQGADAIMYFQWRQSRGGAEKFHSAMVPHAGPGSQLHRDVAALGAELASLPEIVGTRPRNDVALVLDWASWRALELDARPSSDVKQIDALLAHHAPLFDANVGCDVVSPADDLGAYRLVVVPNLYLVSEADAARLTEYVRTGGHLLVSFFSGIVDESDRVHLGGYPAPFRELLGLRVEEFLPLDTGSALQVELLGQTGGAMLWSERIVTEGAEVLGRFDDGTPTLTRAKFGQGVAWYLGTRPDPGLMRALSDHVVAEAGVEPVLAGLPSGVQAARRGEFLFLLNHNPHGSTVDVDRPMTDLLSPGKGAAKRVELPARGVAVLR
ncbi:beta-galactosidase [Allokutzneria oryzae]|uniref:Beta-galactosidase n=1 Tax=Allokutzneria oryzae TaxID=1378989 RepID=A0ABV5ZPJ7_9PSEU